MDTKSLFQSKTLWFNGVMGAVGLAQQLQGVFPDNAKFQTTLASVLAIGNFVLRFATNCPVGIVKK